MNAEHEPQEHQEPTEKKVKVRSSQHSADFMRVEDIGTMPGMTPFELEAKKKMASLSRSPLDDLIQAEEVGETLKWNGIETKKIKKLIRSGVLTRRQRLVYELSFVSRLPDREIADLLEISEVTVRLFRYRMRRALKKALNTQEFRRSLWQRACFTRLTQWQRQIVKLHYRDGLSVKDIASKLGRRDRSILGVLECARKRIFPE